MTFLAPGFLAVAGLAALGIVGLHFLSTREPRTELLPTARFVPDARVQARALTVRLSDVALLCLRVLLVLLVGAALARPVLTPSRRPVARIVAVDVSWAVGQPAELADSARAYLADASAAILFDATARAVAPAEAAESLAVAERRGSLSAALVTALRAASRLRDEADSLELVIVSPFVREERDAATAAIRALWPGRITTVPVSAAAPPAELRPAAVEWADSGATDLWAARLAPDTIGGARAGEAVLVYPFVRRWRPAAEPDGATRVYARWMDGEPAALERATAGGCLRSVAVPLPAEGDALLRPDFQRFVERLSGPCGEPRDHAALPAAFGDTLRGAGPLAPASAIARPMQRVTPLMPWLLAAALLLALVEPWLRRRATRDAPASGGKDVSPANPTRSVA